MNAQVLFLEIFSNIYGIFLVKFAMNENESHSANILAKLLPGAAQGATVTFVGHPFDTIKTRLQSGLYGKGMLRCIQQTCKNEGFKGLYRGASVPLVSHVLKRSYQFPIFHHLHDVIGLNPYLAGLFSGATGTIIGVPLQVTKVNSQASTGKQYKNALDFVKQHYSKTGIRGFYKGLGINMMKDSVFASVFLGNYTLLRNLTTIEKLGHTGNFVAGGAAHMVTWSVFIPIDHVKTQVQKANNNKTVTSVVKETIQSGRYLKLWRGVGPAVLRIFPVSGAGMTVYEIVRSQVN